MTAIHRRHLRTDVRRHLVGRLFSRRLKPGSQIIERQLADDLGVSRTPLREALLQLEFEGFLESHPGRGFMVRDLVQQEATELFELGGVLEPLALRKAGLPSPEMIALLEEVNERRAQLIDDPEQRRLMVELDDQWHRALVSGCRNGQLLEILRLLRNRLYRYVVAFTAHRDYVVEAVDEHRRVLEALHQGDLERAALRLEEHWRTGDRAMRKRPSREDGGQRGRRG